MIIEIIIGLFSIVAFAVAVALATGSLQTPFEKSLMDGSRMTNFESGLANGTKKVPLSVLSDGANKIALGGDRCFTYPTKFGQDQQLCFQTDGNLVLYRGSNPLWSTNTSK